MPASQIFENADQAPVGSLHAYHRNPRQGDVDAIAESLKTTGQYRPIIVNRGTKTGRRNEVLAGNHTLAAAKKLGWADIGVTWLDVDEDTARRIVLADNRTADLGGYDDSVLLSLLQEMPDLIGTGYDGDDLLALMGDQYQEPEYAADPDDIPDIPDEPRCQPGEVWILGPHRLIVGDSTDSDVIARLMRADRADVVWTDPPYGVEYEGKTKKKLRIQNDGAVGLPGLLQDAFTAWVHALRPGAPVYVAHADTERITFETALRQAGYSVRQNLIWAKNTIVLGRSDYHWKHEPILYGFAPIPSDAKLGRLGRGGPHWHGDNAQATVFQVDKPSASEEHPTMKPTALITAQLKNSAKHGDIVFDGFAGSGSTLVAADQLGMVARVVELDPRFADVICERYRRLTGIHPTLEE